MGGELGDFELKLSFKIIGNRGNSGVQYRSRDLGNHLVAGYQCNIQANRVGVTGILEEMRNGRGGRLAEIGQKVHLPEGDIRKVVGKTGDVEQINTSFRKGSWKELRIRAEGNHLRHWLNGQLAVDVTDDDTMAAARQGLLALQLHSGPPMKIEFKDIRLRKLN